MISSICFFLSPVKERKFDDLVDLLLPLSGEGGQELCRRRVPVPGAGLLSPLAVVPHEIDADLALVSHRLQTLDDDSPSSRHVETINRLLGGQMGDVGAHVAQLIPAGNLHDLVAVPVAPVLDVVGTDEG